MIGRRDRLPAGLAERIARAEERTAQGRRLHLRIAVDYSSRDAILAAASRLAEAGEVDRGAFSRLIAGDTDTPDVDLLIRTSGEQRLSDFLLWESAYAELHFTQTLWPDFGESDLRAAVEAFSRRNRRFGGCGDSPGRRTDRTGAWPDAAGCSLPSSRATRGLAFRRSAGRSSAAEPGGARAGAERSGAGWPDRRAVGSFE